MGVASKRPARRPAKEAARRSSAVLPRPIPAVARRESLLVLVVDDLADNREMYVEYLEFQGHRVISATNGREAVASALAHRPDVIVMDMSLPEMDGWEATAALRATPEAKHALIIALSGHAEPHYRGRALTSGCDLFVAKPCLPQDLLTHIREQLAMRMRSRPRAGRGK